VVIKRGDGLLKMIWVNIQSWIMLPEIVRLEGLRAEARRRKLQLLRPSAQLIYASRMAVPMYIVALANTENSSLAPGDK
jgi:hypothetical protein